MITQYTVSVKIKRPFLKYSKQKSVNFPAKFFLQLKANKFLIPKLSTHYHLDEFSAKVRTIFDALSLTVGFLELWLICPFE